MRQMLCFKLLSDIRWWKHPCGKMMEDQLREALIKPGDSVIIRKRSFSRHRCLGGVSEWKMNPGGTTVEKNYRPWHYKL